jgi:hypothetical protein
MEDREPLRPTAPGIRSTKLLGAGLLGTLVEVAAGTACRIDELVTAGARDVVAPKLPVADPVALDLITAKEDDTIPAAWVEVAPLPLTASPRTDEITTSARRARVPPTTTVWIAGAAMELEMVGAATEVALMLPFFPIELEGLPAEIEVAPG